MQPQWSTFLLYHGAHVVKKGSVLIPEPPHSARSLLQERALWNGSGML